MRLTFDWYKKTTKDWLVQAPILDTAGTWAPYINGGDVENKGFEVALQWNDKRGRDFTYGGGINLSYNKNRVTRIANSEGVIHGPGDNYRAQVGFPIGMFYGYKSIGVFQTQQQINDWKAAGGAVATADPWPGDLILVDQNGDGKINTDDKTMIGNPNPKFRLGFNFNVGYRGLDFSVTCAGAFGHDIFFGYRGRTTYALDRWHGTGTSNRYGSCPLSDGLNDTQIEKGDYLRVQNVTLGYDLKRLLPRMPLSQLRLYVAAQNLFTFTAYHGLDPEVGFGGSDGIGNQTGWMSGMDYGSYPVARTVLVGVNVKF